MKKIDANVAAKRDKLRSAFVKSSGRIRSPGRLWSMTYTDAVRLIAASPGVEVGKETADARLEICRSLPCSKRDRCRGLPGCQKQNVLTLKVRFKDIACPRGHWGQE